MSIFSTLIQQAKDLVTPPVQMGEPLRKDSIDAKDKKKVEDSEMNEDGFVCIGRSSFYQSESQSGTYNFPTDTTGNHQQFYSQFPSHSGGHQNFNQPQLNDGNPYASATQCENRQAVGGTGKAGQSIGIGDFVQNVPMVLHPSLQPYVHMYDARLGARKSSSCQNIDWSQFDYDFDFERRVIVEMNQQSLE